jgi:hypothetical protein
MGVHGQGHAPSPVLFLGQARFGVGIVARTQTPVLFLGQTRFGVRT